VSRSIDEVLMPGGQPLGVKGTRGRRKSTVREVPGGQAEAEALFAELTQGGGTDVTPPGHPGRMVELPGGRGTVSIRPASKSGPPTIDVNVTDSTGASIPIRKIKFVG
jgi:hypothetical protein